MVRLFASLSAVALLAGAAHAQAQPGTGGNPEAGEKVFKQCAVCHTVEKGKNKIGPSLYGVIGRKSGSIEDFNYSPAMKSANIVWTPENLDKYLTSPKEMVPGNKMAFPGLKNEEDRKNVIAYLEQVSKEKK